MTDLPARGARLTRRGEGAYRQYSTEEHNAGRRDCPAREVSRHFRDTPLAVVSSHVVHCTTLGRRAEGGTIPQTRVGPVAVIETQPRAQCPAAAPRARIRHGVGPFAEHRLNKAFSLSVGLRAVRARFQEPDVGPGGHGLKDVGGIGLVVVGQYALNANAADGKPVKGTTEKPSGGGAGVVGQEPPPPSTGASAAVARSPRRSTARRAGPRWRPPECDGLTAAAPNSHAACPIARQPLAARPTTHPRGVNRPPLGQHALYEQLSTSGGHLRVTMHPHSGPPLGNRVAWSLPILPKRSRVNNVFGNHT